MEVRFAIMLPRSSNTQGLAWSHILSDVCALFFFAPLFATEPKKWLEQEIRGGNFLNCPSVNIMEAKLKMKRILVISIVTLICVFVLFFSLVAQEKAETLEKTFSIDGSQPVFLEFKDVDGNLKLSGSEGNLVQVKVKKEVDTKDLKRAAKLLRETEIEFSQNGNSISIEVKYPKIKGVFFWLRDYERVKVSTEIVLPLKSNLRCTLVDGSISGEKVQGEMNLKTVDGTIRLTDAEGTIQAKTVHGRIILKNIKGKVDANTTDGDITLSGRIKALSLETTDGDITAEVMSQSQMEADWLVKTTDGDVDFYMAPDFSADFLLQTDDGHIDCHLPLTFTETISEKKLSGKIGQGGYILKIKTGGGTISLGKLFSPEFPSAVSHE
jgi:hypothetical protein